MAPPPPAHCVPRRGTIGTLCTLCTLCTIPRPPTLPSPPLIASDVLHDLPDAPLVLGLSGGLDSAVLLHLLAGDRTARAHGLRAIHVHHGLQAVADAWPDACARMCNEAGIGLQVLRVEVRAEGSGPEAAARDARHRAFADHLRAGEVLVLAQHRDDQAETFLLRALRGSGVDGLAAMQRWRAFGSTRLWRPLLDIPRAALEAYARSHGLAWVDDPSNDDDRFDRNYLRRHVLPLLRQRWPHADAALARSAALCAAADRLLAQEDAAALAAAQGAQPQLLSRSVLASLPADRRARVLRAWVAGLGLPPLPARGVAVIDTQLLHSRPDAGAAFRWGDVEVRTWRDLLRAGPVRAGLPADWTVEWDGRTPLALPDGGTLALEGAPALALPGTVRSRRGGERMRLAGRPHHHTLKHILQDLAVPPWQRRHLPLLTAPDGELLAAGDVAYSAPFAQWLQQHGARLRWRPPFD